MCDIEILIDNTFPIIEGMLKRSGSFPLQASVIKPDSMFTRVSTYNGAEGTSSAELITELKKAFRKKTGCYRSVAVFSDIITVDPNTSLQTQAIKVYIEAKNEPSAYIFYYPYSIAGNRQVRYSDTWSQITRKEIFDESEAGPEIPVFIQQPEISDDAISGRARRSALEKFWGRQSRPASRFTPK